METFLTLLTFFQHSHFEAFHKATGLTRFASPFRDLALICGGTAVFYVTWWEKTMEKSLIAGKTSKYSTAIKTGTGMSCLRCGGGSTAGGQDGGKEAGGGGVLRRYGYNSP